MDQSKKTMRHFYCRDVLWETFEQMANDFDCSIDYLVNEAMRYYARSKNYQSPGGPSPGGPGAGGGGGNGPASYPPGPGGGGGNGGGGPAPKPRPQPSTQPPPHTQAATSAQPRRPPAPTPGYNGQEPRTTGQAERRPAAGSGGGGAMPATNHMRGGGGEAPSQGGPTLFLVYNGQRYPVTKDQFIIGRGSKTSDLPIKDGNISRKHAAVIRRNGTFYIKDLGSTNGIDYKGMRIDNKRIDEGDVFHLCDYELRFTYRAD
jgi:hypothetical protein